MIFTLSKTSGCIRIRNYAFLYRWPAHPRYFSEYYNLGKFVIVFNILIKVKKYASQD